MSESASGRHGITLVEVLVVIAIFAMLLFLLIPALNNARSRSRRMDCINNLKQLALAADGYHEANHCFPYNYGNTASLTAAGSATCRSWLVAIFPYIEQESLYEACTSNKSPISLTAAAGVSDGPAATVVSTLLCPMALNPQSGRANAAADFGFPKGGPAVTNYKACAGANWGANNYPSSIAYGNVKPSWNPKPTNGCNAGPYKFTTSTTVGRNAGTTDGFEHGTGVICRNWTNLDTNLVSMKDIHDGTSNTFFAGETVASWNLWNWWYWPNCATATCAIDLNWPTKRPDAAAIPPNGPSFLGDQYQTGGFHSQHPGGANFAFCDGSVIFLSDAVDQVVYRDLATVSGGEEVQRPE